MEIEIFDVEHGACALVTSPNGKHMLIDCGSNNNSGWRPSVALPARGIHQIKLLVVTNYDEDHVSDLVNFRKQVKIDRLLRNTSVSPTTIKQLKSKDGMGAGIADLCKMASRYNQPGTSIDWGGIKTKTFYNKYPGDFTDENNLSLAYFLEFEGLKIVFTGDLEKAGWKKLLERKAVRDALEGVNVFIASHHGRESGCCEEVFEYCEPDIVIVSDKKKAHLTQETIDWYASRCNGISYRGSTRKVFTTRRDGNIRLAATPYGFDIQTDKGLTSDPLAEALETMGKGLLVGGLLGLAVRGLR